MIQQKRKSNILFHIQFFNQMKCLKNKANIPSPENRTLFLIQREQILPVQKNLPLRGSIQTANALKQGTFP